MMLPPVWTGCSFTIRMLRSAGCGFSFGAWISMQLLMRRPEIVGFLSVAPPASEYDFSFLAPCPSSGLMLQGEDDETIPPESVAKLVENCLLSEASK